MFFENTILIGYIIFYCGDGVKIHRKTFPKAYHKIKTKKRDTVKQSMLDLEIGC